MASMARANDDIELSTATVLIEQKRFHISFKQNGNCRFLKIAELNNQVQGRFAPHRTNKVIIPVGAINEFRDILTGYTEDAALRPEAAQELSTDGKPTEISNDVIRSDNKTIFCDLKANQRGMFLKL